MNIELISIIFYNYINKKRIFNLSVGLYIINRYLNAGLLFYYRYN